MILGDIKARDYEGMAWEVFVRAVDAAGGPRELARQRNLTWLPSLAEAAYAVVLAREAGRTEGEIAEFLGVATQTVRQILRAKDHNAGRLASAGYESLKKEPDAQPRWRDEVHWRVFQKAVELLGGLAQLAEKRRLTWLPSLMTAAMVVSAEKEGKSPGEIADQLGITEATVRRILRADPSLAREGRLEDMAEHKAGALAKWAAKELGL